jgi:Kelch motif
MSCTAQTCKNEAEIRCECNSPHLLFCELHISLHIREPGSHILKPYNISIDESLKKVLIISFRNCIYNSKTTKEDLIKKSNALVSNIIKQTTESCEKIRESENMYIKAIEYLQTEKYIKNNSPVGQFVLKYLENQHLIETDFAKMRSEVSFIDNSPLNFQNSKRVPEDLYLELERNKEFYQKSLDELQDQINTLTCCLEEKEILNKYHNSSFLCYFEKNSKNLIKLQVLKDSDLKIPINMNDDMDYKAGYCELPKDRFFYYGGYPSTRTDYVYIINAEKNSAVKRPNRKIKHSMGCCYYNDFVYIFGGYLNGNYTKDAEKYHIGSDTWKELQMTPEDLEETSIVSSQNKILLVGYRSLNVYVYSISTNSYYSTYVLTEKKCKFVVNGLGKVYIFENFKLHESDSYSSINFTHISNTIVPNFYLRGYTIRNEYSLYFLLEDWNIYRFNLLTKETCRLRAVKFS